MIPRYTPPDIAAIWSDDRKYALWLEVELAAMKTLEASGAVPTGTSDSLRKTLIVNPAECAAIEAEIKHDVLAFVTHLERQCGPEGKWIHYALTSSDVTDTAIGMQIRDSAAAVLPRANMLVTALTDKAREHHATPMVGRTHGVHAEPTTFGHVLANHVEEVQRRVSRLAACFGASSVGKLSGAVGVRPHFDEQAEVEALHGLGLRMEKFASQVITRDRHADLISAIALLGTAVERLAVNVRHLHRTEVGEAMESFGSTQRGSSAMPHKQNPVLCENMCGMARLLRSYVHPAMEDMVLWHERDISHSSVERVILPDAMCVIAYLLDTAKTVVEGLRVNKGRMLQTLESGGGAALSGHVLLLLIRKGMSREQAYLALRRASNVARALPQSDDGPFLVAMLGEQEAMKYVTKDELRERLSWKHTVKTASESVTRAYGLPSE